VKSNRRETCPNVFIDMHLAGVFHCDMKLDNLIYLRGSLLVGIIHMGRAMFGDLNTLLDEDCNPSYMSPERLLGMLSVILQRLKLTLVSQGIPSTAAACDMWALGSLCFELLTGRRMHRSDLQPLTQLTAMVRLHGNMDEAFERTARRAKPDFFTRRALRPTKWVEEMKIQDVFDSVEVSPNLCPALLFAMLTPVFGRIN
jgi:serine/threonine protein kinase